GVGVVRHVGEVVDGVVQAVDVVTHIATCFTDGGEQLVESGDFALSSALVIQAVKTRSIDSTNFLRYVNLHGLGVRGADLQGDRSPFQSTTACEQGIARAIAGVGDDVVQLVFQCGVLAAQSFIFVFAVGAVGGLDGQVLHAQHNVGELVQRAFGGLQQGDTVL